jgi:aspartate-semialdehyde dehydrogenase
VTYGGKEWTVQEAKPEAFEGLDFAVFSAGGSISLALAPEAVKRGCIVIDNSSAFRMFPEVPLVVPEINAHHLANHKGIIANPNCSTAIALMGLFPLHQAFGLKKFFASTYQAVSGTGAEAMRELDAQARAWAKGETLAPKVYPHTINFNLIPQVDSFLEDGYTKEEMKMLNEGRKIMDLPGLKVTTTCVRVPVFRAHSIAISAEFERPVDLAVARKAISAFAGAELCDDPASKKYPMPLDYAGKEKCGVGRLRKDTLFDNGLSLWVSGRPGSGRAPRSTRSRSPKRCTRRVASPANKPRMARSNDRAPRHADLHRPVRLFDEGDIPALLKDVKDPLILVLDGVQDPHDLGACLRNAECAGCAFVVITRKNSAPVTDTVRKVAVGAAESLPIVQANNLRNALVKLKDAGVWLAGTSRP